MSLKKQAISGVKWTGIQQIGMSVIGFVISVILARLLSPEEFGLIAMIIVFVGIGNILLNAGMGASLIRTENLTEVDFSTVFFFNLFISILLYILLFFFAPYVALFYNQPELISLMRWLNLIIIINAFTIIQRTRLTKILDFKTQTLISIPAILIGGGIGIFMAMNGWGVWSLVGFQISKALANTILLWHHLRWIPKPVFDIKKFKYHFNFGYKLSLSNLLDTIFDNIYSIVIGKFFPAVQVGYYQRAQSMQMYPVRSASTILNRVTYPLFSKIQNDNKKLKDVYKKILQINMFIMAPVMILLGVLAQPVFLFLFSEKWLPAVPYFQILIPVAILYPLHSFNLNILKVKGKSELYLLLEIIKKIIIVIAIVIGIGFGIKGLLYGSVIVAIIGFFVNSHYSGKLINYGTLQQIKDIRLIVLYAITSGGSIYLLKNYLLTFFQSPLIIISIGLTGGLLIYLSLSHYGKLPIWKDLTNIIKRKDK